MPRSIILLQLYVDCSSRESCGIVQGIKFRYVLASLFLEQSVAAWLRLI